MISIDFQKINGKIKPLHGINNSPITLGEPLPELKEAGIPYVRLHDTGGMYGENRFVDVPNIFRDFDADPADPASYDFAFTDALLKGLDASGMKIFYRLGITIENDFLIKSYRNHPPADFLKWAKICEGIIRHYNCGWADGFHYGIEYWEIWNEPEQPAMWSGSREQYFEFYQVAATYLKKQFPQIKIGGYASSGFCAYTNPEAAKNPKFRSFLVWFDEFFKFLSKTRAPLDFFSWHYYPSTIEDLRANSRYADSVLQKYGYGDVEVILGEWNYIDWSNDLRWDAMKEMPGASFVAAALCAMQNLNIDMGLYYDALPNRIYCGLYYFPSCRVTKTYYALRMFNELYKLGDSVECSMVDGNGENALGVSGNNGCAATEHKNIHALAASGADECAAMIVNLDTYQKELRLSVSGVSGKPSCTLLDATHTFTSTDTVVKSNDMITLPGRSVILLTWNMKQKS